MKTGESTWKDIMGDSRAFDRETENDHVDEKQRTNQMVNNWLVDDNASDVHGQKKETENTEE